MLRRTKLAVGLIIQALTVIALALPTTSASARLTKCRADPIFYLSNGEILTVVLDIAADEKMVGDVHYLLQLPKDVHVTRVVFTAGGIGDSETYEQVGSGDGYTYITETVVSSKGHQFAVTVTASIRGGTKESVSGSSGHPLEVGVYQDQAGLRK